MLDAAALSIKKFRKVTNQIQKLSTGQKIVGGIALLVAGLTYLSKLDLDMGTESRSAPAPSADEPRRLGPAPADAQDDGDATGAARPPQAPRKTRKPAKAKHDG